MNNGLTPLQRAHLIKMSNEVIEIQKQIANLKQDFVRLAEVVEDLSDTTFDIKQLIDRIKKEEL